MFDLGIAAGIIIAALAIIGLGLSIALLVAYETIRNRYETEDE